MQGIIIAIDGYSGCGKSSTAKGVAEELGYLYLDSGAMYRAVTLYFIRQQIDLSDSDAVRQALNKINIRFHRNKANHANETYLNGENVEKEIRKMEVSERVSDVSAVTEVRTKMVDQQRQMGEGKGIVMDGRDIGTNVFPNAELKVFMKADLQVRALRRKGELQTRGVKIEIEEILCNLSERDRIDTERKENPLTQAYDAVVIDTTHMTLEEQIAQVVSLARHMIRS